MPSPRLAARGLLLIDDRLLLVNAWPGHRGGLWCAPGGGVDRGRSLPENLAREFHEETGLTVSVGDPCLINEFPEGVVTHRRLFSRAEMAGLKAKPDSLAAAAWGQGILYDPLEPILR